MGSMKWYEDEARKVPSGQDIQTSKLEVLFKFARRLKQQGMLKYREDDIEHAYILMMRFVTLSVESIPQHPQYQRQAQPAVELWGEVSQCMTFLEDIKPRLRSLCEERDLEQEQARRAAAEEATPPAAAATVPKPNERQQQQAQEAVPSLDLDKTPATAGASKACAMHVGALHGVVPGSHSGERVLKERMEIFRKESAKPQPPFEGPCATLKLHGEKSSLTQEEPLQLPSMWTSSRSGQCCRTC